MQLCSKMALEHYLIFHRIISNDLRLEIKLKSFKEQNSFYYISKTLIYDAECFT